MANETRTGSQQHHPDTRRDFETGTVNPGPGMAGPIDGKNPTPGQGTAGQQRQSPQHEAEQTGQQAKADEQKQDGCGSCGCG